VLIEIRRRAGEHFTSGVADLKEDTPWALLLPLCRRHLQAALVGGTIRTSLTVSQLSHMGS
jgi:hypothetical protein